MSLVKGGLSQQSTGLGIFEIPAGAAVNPVYHLALGVHQLIAHQQPLVQLNWPAGSEAQGLESLGPQRALQSILNLALGVHQLVAN